MKRFSALMIAALLLIGGAMVWSAGQADAPEEQVTPSGPINTYPMEGSPQLSYARAPDPQILAVVDSWAETPFVKAWQEQTGVELDVSFYNDFALLVASGDYPDMILGNWNAYPGGATGAIKDGIVVPVESYLPVYAPDYLAALRSSDEWEKGAKTPDGHIPGFFNMRAESARKSWGLIMRKDWLDDLGLEVPKTADQYRDALAAFRNEKGATVPFSTTLGNLRNAGTNGLMTSPFGLVSTGYYHIDNVVHFGAAEDEYRDYLAWLNEMYEDGLIDKNILTVDNQTEASNILNGFSGSAPGFASGRMGVWLSTMADVDPNYDLAGVGSLVANVGDRAMFGQRAGAFGQMVAITTDCEDIEAAVRFLNYGYTEEGNLLMYYGIEGISFEMIDGYPYYTDFVKNNPDGLSFRRILVQYDYSPNHGPYISNGDYSLQTYNEAQLNALQVWRDTDEQEHFIPPLDIDPSRVDEYAAIWSEVSTYVNEQFALFLIGSRSLDEFDDYLRVLDDMGVDRMIEIYQESLDEFNAR